MNREQDLIRKIVRNSDNEGLLPMRSPQFMIGSVDEVNGQGAKEVSAYVPTHHEMLVLTKYWAERINTELFEFLEDGTGRYEICVKTFGYRRRLERIRELLGEHPGEI